LQETDATLHRRRQHRFDPSTPVSLKNEAVIKNDIGHLTFSRANKRR
jgi:hypothetical protein